MSDYIMDLRKIVVHRTLLQVGASVIVEEETGLTANSLELFGIFSGKELHYIYPNGDEVSNVDIVYICRDYTGTLKRQENEVEELRFFAFDEIPENLSPPIRKPLGQWVKKAQKCSNVFPAEIS